MNFVSVFMTFFAVAGAIDRIFNNRLGLGARFEDGIKILGQMVLSMAGMIMISPLLAELLEPFFGFVYNSLGIDPSTVTSMLFANDMGGAQLAQEVSKNSAIGNFNGLVVGSMMGCTVSFTVPYAITAVKKEHHNDMLFGFLCGIITIPVGAIASGLIFGVPLKLLFVNMLPLVIFSAVIALCLALFPNASIKVFKIFGVLIKIVITLGLILGIIKFLTGTEIVKGLDSFENAGAICLHLCAVMSGAFVFLDIVSRLLKKPLSFFGKRIGIDEASSVGFVNSLATTVTTFEMTEKMNRRGIVLNSAFAISGAFVLADHLAFTLAFDSGYVGAVVVAKLVSGIFAVILAQIIFNKREKKNEIDKVNI